MTAWATPAEVSSITNKAVSQEDLDSAQSVIDIYSNATFEASGSYSGRDIRWLKYAVAWQAVFQAARVSYGEVMDTDQVTQDGHTYSKGYADSYLLAPLARKSLFRVSWMKVRTLDPLSAEEVNYIRNGRALWYSQGTEEWTDDFQRWEPM